MFLYELSGHVNQESSLSDFKLFTNEVVQLYLGRLDVFRQKVVGIQYAVTDQASVYDWSNLSYGYFS